MLILSQIIPVHKDKNLDFELKEHQACTGFEPNVDMSIHLHKKYDPCVGHGIG